MAKTYLVAFWNLENLFAPEGFPAREPWIARRMAGDLKGWTEARFDRKIAQLAAIVARMNGGAGPDLLGVCEVENRHALQRLADRLNDQLPGRRYDVVHVDATRDQRGIDTAFLFAADALDVNRDEVFSHWVMRRTGTRDITQATFITRDGAELVALANHWPSRSGTNGPEYSRGFRATAGEALGYWHERIREIKGDGAGIIAMGDFNDEPYDASITIHANASRERGDVTRGRSARFYNLAWRYLTQQVEDRAGRSRRLDGTLYFGGNGNVFDQILISKGLMVASSPIRAVEDSARIETFPEMVDTRPAQGPIRFGLPKGDPDRWINPDGYSDHFPVSVELRER